MTARFPKQARWLLCALASVLVAGNCGDTGPVNRLYLVPALSNVPPLTWVTVDVMADVNEGSLQAFDLGVRGTLGTVFLNEAETGEFDDDGDFFLEPIRDVLTNTLSRIVDLRHGDSAATGTVRLARLQIFALSPGTATISFVDADFADPTGSQLTATVGTATIVVAP